MTEEHLWEQTEGMEGHPREQTEGTEGHLREQTEGTEWHLWEHTEGTEGHLLEQTEGTEGHLREQTEGTEGHLREQKEGQMEAASDTEAQCVAEKEQEHEKSLSHTHDVLALMQINPFLQHFIHSLRTLIKRSRYAERFLMMTDVTQINALEYVLMMTMKNLV